MPNLRNGSKGDSNPASLDCESGILPLSYRAPFYRRATMATECHRRVSRKWRCAEIQVEKHTGDYQETWISVEQKRRLSGEVGGKSQS